MTHPWRSIQPLILAAALLAACTDIPSDPGQAAPRLPDAPAAYIGPGGLEWFGYVDGVKDTESIIGTKSYANFGFIITNATPTSTYVRDRLSAISPYSMKGIVELGLVLWCGAPEYRYLCPDYQQRWATWKVANDTTKLKSRVLGFIIRDEPFLNGVNPADWERAASMVKRDFPNAKILLIEFVGHALHAGSALITDTIIKTVDWVGVSTYSIHPQTDANFRSAISSLKTRFPGRGLIYVGDGFWDIEHATRLNNNITAMGSIAQEWFDAAKAEPAVKLLGFFTWERLSGATTSKDFPPSVLQVHTNIGRAITGRQRTQSYLPTGRLATVKNNGALQGLACDPDGAWGEAVTVDVYNNGQWVMSGKADQPGGLAPECRSGNSHSFYLQMPVSPGRTVSVVARDLDSGSRQLVTTPYVEVTWVQPSGVTWGPPNTFTAAGTARNGTGGVQLQWRDITTSTTTPWNVVPWAPEQALDATWSNTVPVSADCRTYQVKAIYSGVSSQIQTFRGNTAGYC